MNKLCKYFLIFTDESISCYVASNVIFKQSGEQQLKSAIRSGDGENFLNAYFRLTKELPNKI